MTSYGDVRKIIDDISNIFKIVKTICNASRERRVLGEQVCVLMEDVQNTASKLDPSKSDYRRLVLTHQQLDHLAAQLRPPNSRTRRFMASLAWPKEMRDFNEIIERSAEINNTVQTNLVADTTRSIARRIQKTERDSKIEQFILLNAPEVSKKILLQPAGLDLVQGTGEWIFGYQKFKKWLQSRDGCLWIKGTAGCVSAFSNVSRRKGILSPLRWPMSSVVIKSTGYRDLQDPMDIAMSFWKHLIDQIREYNRHFDPRLTRLKMPGLEKEAFNEKPRLSDKELRKQQKQQFFLHAVTTSDITLILDGLDEIPRNQQSQVISSRETIQKIIQIEEVYERALDRLQKNSAERKRTDGRLSKAIHAIFWVAYAKNTLLRKQLKQALAWIDREPKESSDWTTTVIDDLTSGLVVTRNDDSVALVHKTLSEYLEQTTTREKWFPTIEKHIPTVLLRLLRYLVRQKSDMYSGTAQFLTAYPLCLFALQNWGLGLEKALSLGDSLCEDVRAFLRVPFHDWSQELQQEARNFFKDNALVWRDQYEHLPRDFSSPGTVSALYWVVKFQLTTLIEEFSDCTSECLVQDPLPILPLGLAAGLGHVDTVQKLLDIGAKVDVPSGANRMVKPPLYDAFWMDELPTAKLLLNHGADPTPRRGENGQSPIDVLYLQHRDACCDFFASHISGSAPTRTQELQYLVRTGYAEDLQRAINEGLDVNHPCENGKTALDYAMEMGDSKIIEILQSSNARANLQWPARETAVYPYKSNLPDLAIAPIAQGCREWDNAFSMWQFKEEVLLEIPVNWTDPVQCIILNPFPTTKAIQTAPRIKIPTLACAAVWIFA
ncbi:hypothetical protein BB8028_0006g01030 [Beauveria bassiana]|uniref:Nephrocystin 3-like N-terminal domain-containing protein n=1 Tax=Beauveria bassiana TaxID=176275 RepID=A0A2S7YHY0_BEABA|nr:hypothetical protein BB8028_0006g01030 [Beauveria bassiana]